MAHLIVTPTTKISGIFSPAVAPEQYFYVKIAWVVQSLNNSWLY